MCDIFFECICEGFNNDFLYISFFFVFCSHFPPFEISVFFQNYDRHTNIIWKRRDGSVRVFSFLSFMCTDRAKQQQHHFPTSSFDQTVHLLPFFSRSPRLLFHIFFLLLPDASCEWGRKKEKMECDRFIQMNYKLHRVSTEIFWVFSKWGKYHIQQCWEKSMRCIIFQFLQSFFI